MNIVVFRVCFVWVPSQEALLLLLSTGSTEDACLQLQREPQHVRRALQLLPSRGADLQRLLLQGLQKVRQCMDAASR